MASFLSYSIAGELSESIISKIKRVKKQILRQGLTARHLVPDRRKEKTFAL